MPAAHHLATREHIGDGGSGRVAYVRFRAIQSDAEAHRHKKSLCGAAAFFNDTAIMILTKTHKYADIATKSLAEGRFRDRRANRTPSTDEAAGARCFSFAITLDT